MQISEAAAGAGGTGAGADAEPCRFPKLEECAHFHYERVQLPQLTIKLQTGMDQSLHSQHATDDADVEWFVVQVTSGDACWIVQRSFDNFRMLDDQLHRCIFDRKISQLQDLADASSDDEDLEERLTMYLERLSEIADNSVNCGPVLNWLQMDNRGRRLLVPSEESRSINTPAVAAAYSVRRYVSQARDELNLEVGDMISVIDMASPGESMWWRGKRGFQVGFFPQHCVHIIGDKVPRNMPLPPPVVGSLALASIKPVLRKHGKLIAFFRSFILNRPSRRRLKQSGILKERVFGCDLGEHLLNSRHDVPTVLKCCADFIESKGIVDGIYRLSGVTSNIQKLRNAFDEDRIPNLYTEDIIQDIHSVASLLKMYFRELPNPLCTYQLYQNFVNAVQGCSTAIRNSETDHQRLLKMREAVQKLPPPHYRTLEYLMRHLARVAKHGSRTGMTTRNVAIVWAPNLLRCEALEVGGVAALQGVGVQAVVTEFLICYADLIFCDHLPNLDQPSASDTLLMRKCRPNSLAISTPTKLITLEEARSKHLPHKIEECNYIEVGGGPNNLPRKYHTVIDLPPGTRKRGHTKRSPLGWRLFFSKSRNPSQSNLLKTRKSTTPITINEKSVTESDLTDMKRKLRSVKSAESLTSGHSEPASTEDVLGPLCSLNKPPGHNRSVSHDSYFDMLQNSQNNSEGSLLDLSEIQLNFDLEESEMRIFSEDESLVSSPRIQKETQRRILTRARPEEYSSATNSVDPSPKKQPRVVLSPESQSRKRTRLEDQLSDIQYIDCNTPDNVVSTTAVIHPFPESPVVQKNKELFESYQPKNKSPRNSDNVDKRQSLNLEASAKPALPKSLTELDLNQKYLAPDSLLTTPTPGSPAYKQLGESSTNTTPDYPPGEVASCKDSHNYENVLMTINITYRSPSQSTPTSPVKTPVSNIYENVVLNPEKVSIPTSTASLPIQEAAQPCVPPSKDHCQSQTGERPKSLSALEDLTSKDSTIKANLSSSAICNTSDQSLGSLNEQNTLSSNRSSSSNVQYTASVSSAPYHCIENSERLSASDLSLSEVAVSPNSTASRTSLSFPASPSKDSGSPNVSPTQVYDCCSLEGLTTETSDRLSLENLDNIPTDCASWANDGVNSIDFSPDRGSINEKRKSEESEGVSDAVVYQQVKYFRRSIHEVNAMVELEDGESASLEEDGDREHVYEDVLVRSEEGVNRNCDQEEVSDTVQEAQTKNVAIEDNYDSLEPENRHIYENLDGDDAVETTVYENVDLDRDKTESPTEAKPEAPPIDVVRETQTTAENPQDEASAVTNDSEDSITDSSTNNSDSFKLRKFYEKDSLPPCLRARNLKHRLKTRSLDEEEFEKEFAVRGCKTNSLPKTLNAPKAVPGEDGRARSAHLAHSVENIKGAGGGEEEEQKKRERIEKYKEERRKILQDKYRSESFKENKEVLLTRLRIFKQKDEPAEPAPPNEHDRRDAEVDSEPGETARKEPKPMTESLRSRAAIFEPKVASCGGVAAIRRGSSKPALGGVENREEADDLKDLDFIRDKRKDGEVVKERRRHTFDTRDRESDAERSRRISLESRSPRKEKTSPTYCIKDMKAIFESKSKQ